MQFVAYPDVSNSDLLSSSFHEQHLTSTREFMVSRSFDSSVSGVELYDTIKAYGDSSWAVQVAIFSDSWTILCESSSLDMGVTFTVHSSNVWVNLSCRSYEASEKFFKALKDGLPPVGDSENLDKIDVRFWMLGGASPTSQVRTLDTFHWGDVSRNYPGQVGEQLADLMTMPSPEVGGKLILWHGHPGGGKTSAIKTLADSWRKWANTEYIVDPEAFFGSAAYMISVLNRGGLSADVDPEKWRVIIIEDAGQFVNKNADTTTGQAFSRLLNVTDGMIGQGMRVVVLITTNQPLSEMHEALRRPGRCLANIEFSKFNSTQASEWLGEPVPSGDMSLAELYESKKSTQIQTKKEDHRVGQYI